ncbi:hypothetical protein ACJX0J_023795, partial [Zea mays]
FMQIPEIMHKKILTDRRDGHDSALLNINFLYMIILLDQFVSIISSTNNRLIICLRGLIALIASFMKDKQQDYITQTMTKKMRDNKNFGGWGFLLHVAFYVRKQGICAFHIRVFFNFGLTLTWH